MKQDKALSLIYLIISSSVAVFLGMSTPFYLPSETLVLAMLVPVVIIAFNLLMAIYFLKDSLKSSKTKRARFVFTLAYLATIGYLVAYLQHQIITFIYLVIIALFSYALSVTKNKKMFLLLLPIILVFLVAYVPNRIKYYCEVNRDGIPFNTIEEYFEYTNKCKLETGFIETFIPERP